MKDFMIYAGAINLFFAIIFIVEMILKMIGMGFKFYFLDPYNVFDCIIVASSIVDIVLTYSMVSGNTGIMSAIRAFRVIRVFKLAKSWKRF